MFLCYHDHWKIHKQGRAVVNATMPSPCPFLVLQPCLTKIQESAFCNYLAAAVGAQNAVLILSLRIKCGSRIKLYIARQHCCVPQPREGLANGLQHNHGSDVELHSLEGIFGIGQRMASCQPVCLC